MKRIGWYSGSLYLFLWSIVVSCYPSAPGTCNMDLMGTIGHGPSKSSCTDCYRILVHPTTGSSPSSTSDITIKIVGTQAYQGLMLLVKDQTNQTVGRFVDFDDAMFAPVACDDEAIEEESVAVIGHLDPRIKSWPVQVGWQADTTLPLGDYRVQGMVVIDYDNFHMIPEEPFRLERKVSVPAVNSTASVSNVTTTTTDTASSTKVIVETTVDLETEEWPLESVNPFFLKVVMAFMFVYVAMSLILRHILKYRRSRLQQHRHLDQEGDNLTAHLVKTS